MSTLHVDVHEHCEPWYAMCDTLFVQHEVQRTAMMALDMASCHFEGADVVIHTNCQGVVLALKSGDNRCMSSDHNDADWWAFVRQQVRIIEDNVHTTNEQRTNVRKQHT